MNFYKIISCNCSRYRDAGREVVAVLCKFSECVQRASVDEAYIDLTEAVKNRLDNDKDIQACLLKNTFVVGYSPKDSNEEGIVKFCTDHLALVK